MIYQGCPVYLLRFEMNAVKIMNCDELKKRTRTILKLDSKNYENVVKIKYFVFQKNHKNQKKIIFNKEKSEEEKSN